MIILFIFKNNNFFLFFKTWAGSNLSLTRLEFKVKLEFYIERSSIWVRSL